MSCGLLCVDPARIDHAWPLAAEFIRAAMQKTDISDFARVEEDVRAGKALLWLVYDEAGIKAAVVTQIARANGHKFCTIVACGGIDSKEWLPLIHGIEVYARQEDCKAMRIFGRCGWSRVLPDYKIVGHITERTLT